MRLGSIFREDFVNIRLIFPNFGSERRIDRACDCRYDLNACTVFPLIKEPSGFAAE
jgi:hypothetical protein